MRGVLLFITLVLVLLRGLDLKGVPHNSISSHTHHLQKKQQAELTKKGHAYTYVEDNFFDETAYVTGEDVEDDKLNNLFAKKIRLLTKNFALRDLIQLNHLYGGAKGHLSFCGYSPEIYISQRALRI